jgi:hypothetical protein
MTAPLVAVSDIIRNGIVFDFKNWELGRMNEDDLKPMIERLFSLLDDRRVDYVLVGGVALLQYVAGRNTQDIDLIMATSALEKLAEIEIIQQDEDFASGKYEGLQIDILLTHNPLFAYVQRTHSVRMPFAERTIITATVGGLILLKLYALPSLYRQGDFPRIGLYENDVATLLYAYRPDVNAIVDELESFVSASDLQEIRNIVTDLQTRFSRFGR